MGYHFKEGFHSIFTHGFMSFAAVSMIVACLLIMGSFTLVAVNFDNALGALEDENEFLAYIDESLSEEEAKALQSTLEGVDNVASVEFTTNESARDTYAEKYAGDANADLFTTLPSEVFRHRFSVRVVDLSRMSETVEAVGELPEVVNVRAEEELASGFVLLRNIATGVATILVGMLLVISLSIIANTIKLATFTRRDEIAIMKMCGATNWFIRWPFVFEGMILGLLGAIVAYLIQWGLYQMVASAIDMYNGFALITMLPFRQMAGQVFGVFAGAGFLIGSGGSMLAIRKFLQV